MEEIEKLKTYTDEQIEQMEIKELKKKFKELQNIAKNGQEIITLLNKGVRILREENKKLKEENKKIDKAADKMYEYISYYGWEDFESNTGCNREKMVDYFYKE